MSVAVSTVVSPPLCCTRTVLVPICSPLRIMAKLAAVAPPGSCPCASAVDGPNASAATASNNVRNLHIQISLGNGAHLAKERFAPLDPAARCCARACRKLLALTARWGCGRLFRLRFGGAHDPECDCRKASVQERLFRLRVVTADAGPCGAR